MRVSKLRSITELMAHYPKSFRDKIYATSASPDKVFFKSL
jgi:hypothetical protein